MATSAKNEFGLNGQQEAFAVAFIKCGQKAQAYREAYDCSHMKPISVGRRALEVFKNEKVRARIDQLRQEINETVIAQVAERARPAVELIYDKIQVFAHWQDIALADVTNVITHRRVCCRWCHGTGHHYQWRDQDEFARKLAEVMDANNARKRMRPPQRQEDLPTDAGGYGFRFNAKPHQDCPRCLGEGLSDVLLKDFDQLDQRHRRLIKSVEIKKDGSIKVHVHDQAAALTNMAKTLGMLVEKFQLTDGKGDDILPALPLDQTEASRKYAEWIKGGA